MASRGRPKPLLTIDNPPPGVSQVFTPVQDDDSPKKRWYHFIPLYGTIILIFAPHPSLLYFLVHHYLKTLNQPIKFTIHLLVTYTLTFLMCTSLIVLVVRDPGPVKFEEPGRDEEGSEEVGLTEALTSPDDFSAPGKWCRACWAPKPERTHHCSFCGRCVLKMDHHCPWLGNRCIGHRTYPAFLHFILCITLLASYIASISAHAFYYSITHPYNVDEMTPVHELLLAFAGVVFTLVIGSFFLYHLYLVTTNQTTLENISPFLLLRHLPILPNTDHSHRLSDPPLEHELSYQQRRLVKNAHGHIRLYDIGWRKNWSQALGWNRSYGWVHRALHGGSSNGDGKSFPRNVRSEELLARLARDLVSIDK
ncbi:palmitoyltransferase for Vac8p [Stygiomarasmius scandens]|uniref:Palmitoyltransferase n=1 Tax=Marasmiellus scandens TaxID=2682957 RepID=A0ABR1K058_9AGAR